MFESSDIVIDKKSNIIAYVFQYR